MKKEKIFIYLGDGRDLTVKDLDVACDKVVIFDPNDTNRAVVAGLFGERATFLRTSSDLIGEEEIYYEYSIKKLSGFNEASEDIKSLYPSLKLLSSYAVYPLTEAEILSFTDEESEVLLFVGYGLSGVDNFSARISTNFYNHFNKIYFFKEAISPIYQEQYLQDFSLDSFQGGYTVFSNFSVISKYDDFVESVILNNKELVSLSETLDSKIVGLESALSDAKLEIEKLKFSVENISSELNDSRSSNQEYLAEKQKLGELNEFLDSKIRLYEAAINDVNLELCGPNTSGENRFLKLKGFDLTVGELMDEIKKLQRLNMEITEKSKKTSEDIRNLRARVATEKLENRKLVQLLSDTLLLVETSVSASKTEGERFDRD